MQISALTEYQKLDSKEAVLANPVLKQGILSNSSAYNESADIKPWQSYAIAIGIAAKKVLDVAVMAGAVAYQAITFTAIPMLSWVLAYIPLRTGYLALDQGNGIAAKIHRLGHVMRAKVWLGAATGLKLWQMKRELKELKAKEDALSKETGPLLAWKWAVHEKRVQRFSLEVQQLIQRMDDFERDSLKSIDEMEIDGKLGEAAARELRQSLSQRVLKKRGELLGLSQAAKPIFPHTSKAFSPELVALVIEKDDAKALLVQEGIALAAEREEEPVDQALLQELIQWERARLGNPEAPAPSEAVKTLGQKIFSHEVAKLAQSSEPLVKEYFYESIEERGARVSYVLSTRLLDAALKERVSKRSSEADAAKEADLLRKKVEILHETRELNMGELLKRKTETAQDLEKAEAQLKQLRLRLRQETFKLNMDPKTPLSEEKAKQLREKAFKPYLEVHQEREEANKVVEDLRYKLTCAKRVEGERIDRAISKLSPLQKLKAEAEEFLALRGSKKVGSIAWGLISTTLKVGLVVAAIFLAPAFSFPLAVSFLISAAVPPMLALGHYTFTRFSAKAA